MDIGKMVTSGTCRDPAMSLYGLPCGMTAKRGVVCGCGGGGVSVTAFTLVFREDALSWKEVEAMQLSQPCAQ